MTVKDSRRRGSLIAPRRAALRAETMNAVGGIFVPDRAVFSHSFHSARLQSSLFFDAAVVAAPLDGAMV